MADTNCCKALEHAMGNWDRPFYYPTYIDSETHSLRSDRLCLQLFDVNRAGNERKGHRSWATVLFCPFCGRKLVDDDAP